MPSALKRFSSKPSFIPDKRWKGVGWYSKRKVNGKVRWAKYSVKRDLARGSRTRVGSPRKYANITDRNLTKRRRRR